LDFRLPGRPLAEAAALPNPTQVAVLPEHIPFVKPRLHVAQGDAVSIGSVLFEDKRNPRIRFLSPAGGTIGRIQLGPRRVIQAIVIDCQTPRETTLTFPVLSEKALADVDRRDLVDLILNGGLWWIFRELPFRDLPDPQFIPPKIIVALGAKEPFQPLPEVYLRGEEKTLAYGLAVLRRLTQGPVLVAAQAGQSFASEYLDRQVTHVVQGRYPSDDPAALLYHTKHSAEENRAWFVSGQDLLLLAALLQKGRYPIERVMVVGGAGARKPQHYHTRMGVPLAHLAGNQPNGNAVRFVVGGMLRGFASDDQGFMGIYETALNLLPLGGEKELLALFRPGLRKPTFSRTFASRLKPGSPDYTCNLNGEERACIACMHCAAVCPVDILPQLAYKAILVEEVEEYLAHGLLDCAECGLCTYVCPAKIELTRTFVAAKAAYAKERMAS
jgi:Na+-transporting NADH:ubiquinone oxidoreductase subunit A